jgi:hypothetical protein
MHALDPGARVAVFGHDPIREGHLVEYEPLLCVSTSFGRYDGDKVYLEWDLGVPAVSADEVARTGLRPCTRTSPGGTGPGVRTCDSCACALVEGQGLRVYFHCVATVSGAL